MRAISEAIFRGGRLPRPLRLTLRVPAMKDTPVVIMTNYVEDLNNDKIKSLGVLDVFIKYQVVPAQMVAKIKQLLNLQ